MHKGFLKAGDLPPRFASFLYFDLSFMVWVILGPLGVAIAGQLHLNPGQKGLMVAIPGLAGAALRVVLGLLVDRFKPKRVGIGAQIVVIAGLIAAWSIGIDSFAGTLLLGCVLGLAGASFAVALPLASAWYPPEHQGKALGIAGRVTPARSWRPCSHRRWRSRSGGKTSLVSPQSRSSSHWRFSSWPPRTIRTPRHRSRCPPILPC